MLLPKGFLYKETKEALIELWGILIKIEEPTNNTKHIETAIEKVRNIFINAKGFVVKANLRELENCFWVEPNWERYEVQQQHLGKQMLVCLLEDINEVEKIYKYLYMQNKRKDIMEIVFAFNDYSTFNSENRKRIREVFKGKYLRCVFIQQENFNHISEKQDWRNIFYKLLEISKIS